MAQDRYEKRNFTVVGVFGLVLCLFFVSGARASCTVGGNVYVAGMTGRVYCQYGSSCGASSKNNGIEKFREKF